MRFSHVIAYLAVASVSGVLALPLHERDTSSIHQTGNDITHHHDGHMAPAPDPAAHRQPSDDTTVMAPPKLNKRVLFTQQLTAAQHVQQKNHHAGEQATNENQARQAQAAARTAANAYKAEYNSPNRNEVALRQHLNNQNSNLALAQHHTELGLAHAAGVQYHTHQGAIETYKEEHGGNLPHWSDNSPQAVNAKLALGEHARLAGEASASYTAHAINANNAIA
ncbi:hypothetical protein FRC17_004820 [Serendipita sp. 399]|nr:hypothetical protein FRC17_004820 [Serendipita sp. 399]